MLLKRILKERIDSEMPDPFQCHRAEKESPKVAQEIVFLERALNRTKVVGDYGKEDLLRQVEHIGVKPVVTHGKRYSQCSI